MEVTKLLVITEEVIYIYNPPLILLLQAGYQMVTKKENVWKLPSYQVTRYY